MRATRILVCLFAVVAVSGLMAAEAAAVHEFHWEKYPVKIEAVSANHGGESTGLAWSCKNVTLKSGEEKANNPTKDSPTLELHPSYKECIMTVLGTHTYAANVVSTGCNYKFHAVKPAEKTGTVDIICETGKSIKVETKEPTFECVLSLRKQNGVKSYEYLDEPVGELTFNGELVILATESESCGLGKVETVVNYRESEETGGIAKLAPPGHPAKTVVKGTEPGSETVIPGEDSLGEPHWYENHVALGTGEEAGEQALLWGKLVLTDAGGAGHIGSAECQTEWDGKVYNPEGAGGAAGPGEAKLVAFQAFNCVSEECKNKSSTLSVTPEGLGVSGLSTLAWEAKLSAGPTRLKIGNAAGSATSIQWDVACTGLAYNKKWAGELAPELENGTAIGSAPSKLTFNSGELKVEGTTEGKVSNKLKLMGYEGGEIISTKSP